MCPCRVSLAARLCSWVVGQHCIGLIEWCRAVLWGRESLLLANKEAPLLILTGMRIASGGGDVLIFAHEHFRSEPTILHEKLWAHSTTTNSSETCCWIPTLLRSGTLLLLKPEGIGRILCHLGCIKKDAHLKTCICLHTGCPHGNQLSGTRFPCSIRLCVFIRDRAFHYWFLLCIRAQAAHIMQLLLGIFTLEVITENKWQH